MPPRMGFWLRGSPPRGRGKVVILAFSDVAVGITPAWAGKRPRNSSRRNTRSGSPPRGRGKVGHSVISTISSGITPAWAGKSATSEKARATKQDHPRVGGEKMLSKLPVSSLKGSPPRGRGKGCLFRLCPRRTGITPAWAGKSYKCPVGLLIAWDHPRVGGEKNIVRKASFDPQGSPPRGRGKDIQCTNGKQAQRITPAWAGKSSSENVSGGPDEDHPRVGGEKLRSSIPLNISMGSPPRGRGKD